MGAEGIFFAVFAFFAALVLALLAALFFQARRASDANAAFAALLQERLSAQDAKSGAELFKLNQDLMDGFTDKFYYLNKSLSEGLQRQNSALSSNLSSLEQGFKGVVQNLALMSEQNKASLQVRDEISRLNAILGNVKLRGNFGEYQLERILSMLYGQNAAFYELQKHLPGGKIADCALHVGKDKILCIDSKFPLSSYEKIMAASAAKDATALAGAQKELASDMKKHIADIAAKYIAPPQTTEFAVLFLPSEAVFIYVCEKLPQVPELGAQNGVFLASPTTLLALLGTIRVFLKDEALAANIKSAKDEIYALGKEFETHAKHAALLQSYAAKFCEQAEILNKNAKSLKARFDKISEI